MKCKLIKLKLAVSLRTQENCVGAVVTLRSVTNLKLMQSRMRKVMWLQNTTVFGLCGEISSLTY